MLHVFSQAMLTLQAAASHHQSICLAVALNGPDDLVQLQGKLQLFPVQAQALAYLTKSDNQIFICNAITMSQLQANKGNAASPLTLPKASLLL